MAAIDIGSAAIDDTDGGVATYTRISLDNPANATGHITSLEVWANTNITNLKIGTFSRSGANFTPRAYVTIASVTSGAKRTFTAPTNFTAFDVVSGDYLGTYFQAGQIEANGAVGGGVYYLEGDQFDAGTQTYTLASAARQSAYGAGETSWLIIAKVSGISEASIGKINGVTKANIAKMEGVAV